MITHHASLRTVFQMLSKTNIEFNIHLYQKMMSRTWYNKWGHMIVLQTIPRKINTYIYYYRLNTGNWLVYYNREHTQWISLYGHTHIFFWFLYVIGAIKETMFRITNIHVHCINITFVHTQAASRHPMCWVFLRYSYKYMRACVRVWSKI